jgi:integrase
MLQRIDFSNSRPAYGNTEGSPAPAEAERFVKSEKAARESSSLKPKEVERLLQAAADCLSLRDYALILTAVRAGLRKGELAGLKWGDIQFGESDDDPDRYALAELRSPLVADHADP